jgi:hypothetical protein
MALMHADAWAAWAQWVTVAIAFGAAVYARGQVLEARKTRERVAQPNVVVFVDRHEVRGYMDLVIKNFGQTSAYNVRPKLPPLQLAPYRNLLTGKEVTNLDVPEYIAVLAPGQEWRTVWDSARRRAKYKGELQSKFVGHVEFDDRIIGGKPGYYSPISLDVNMFWNTTYITERKSETVEKALQEISSTLKNYGEEDRGVWVYTTHGNDERDRRERDREEMRQAHDQLLRDLGAVKDDSAEEYRQLDGPGD